MFVSERRNGDWALVWRSTPPAPPLLGELWTPDRTERHPSDGPRRASEYAVHQGLAPRTTDDAVRHLAEYRHRIATTAPGGALAQFLQHRPARPDQELGLPDQDRLWANVLVDSIQARERLIAHLQGGQVADLAELSRNYPGLREFLSTEIALALGVAETTATRRLDEAEAFTTRLPATFAALHAGDISDRKARAVHQGTGDVTPDVARQVERDVLPELPHSTMPQVHELIAAAVIRRDPLGADDRHDRARGRRSITRHHLTDGMGTLKVFSTLQDIATIHTALTAMGEASATPDDERTADNRRVDALVDVCADVLDHGRWREQPLPTQQRRRPHVHVTMPLTALLPGPPTGDMATLAGYGPITPVQARQIAADATLRRLVCDPLSGTLLDHGRTTYEPPVALADHVLARDLTCVMPGCRQSAWRCELDHTEPFRPGRVTGGSTSAANLAPACKHHHRAKDGGGFRLVRTATGYAWTTPLERTYERPNTRLWAPAPEDRPPPPPPEDPDPPPF
ncbi:MAG TPA: DUF222 domain-containing protein [Nakamurella multipartita]|nr:DUF222 domain-containing protein [Nakamurella multipartita]